MSWGNILVSLREVLSSKKTLVCRSLLKQKVNFWQEDLMKDSPKPKKFMEALICQDCDVDSLTLSPESIEVAYVKKLKKRLACPACNSSIIGDLADSPYFLHLSRVGLSCLYSSFSEFICKGFALLDFLDSFIYHQTFISIRKGSLCMLSYYLADFQFFCDLHLSHGKEATLKMIVNIFYNNKQKAVNDSVLKDSITTFKRR